MIQIKMIGHAFEYEVKDVLKLFFSEQEIICIESGILSIQNESTSFLEIISCVEAGTESFIITTQLKKNHILDSTVSQLGLNIGKKTIKQHVKKGVYEILSRYLNKQMPWGFLTGIRPAKIVHEMLDHGVSKDAITEQLKSFYHLSDEKTDIVYQVAMHERTILKSCRPEKVSLYIGIPFCRTRCLYCSFTSYPAEKYSYLTEPYLNALKKEMAFVAGILQEKGLKIQSIYIGGGTPTALSIEQLENLLHTVASHFIRTEVEEFTLEAGRPDSLDQDKIKCIAISPVTRISINPQTMNDQTLKLIGRQHTAADIVKKYQMARDAGLCNINMDLIAGLPYEDEAMFQYTLEQIKALVPESLTVHTMSVKRASKLAEDKTQYTMTPDETVSRMIQSAYNKAIDLSMRPYYLYRQKNILGNLENIGYARKGYESIYNIQIMEERQTIIALGAGGITKMVYPEENRIERIFNVKNVEQYIERIDEMIDRKKVYLG